MAQLYVNTAKDTAGTSTPVGSASTAAASLTAGNLVGVGIAFVSATAVVTKITDTAGNEYLQCPGAFIRAADGSCTDVWFARNTLGNASNITTVTWSSNVTFNRIIIDQYSGCSLLMPFTGATSGFTAAGTSVTGGNITPQWPNTVIFGICAAGSGSGTYTAGGSFTLRDVKLTDTQTEDRIVSALGIYAPSITYSVSTELVFSAAAFCDTDVIWTPPVPADMPLAFVRPRS